MYACVHIYIYIYIHSHIFIYKYSKLANHSQGQHKGSLFNNYNTEV